MYRDGDESSLSRSGACPMSRSPAVAGGGGGCVDVSGGIGHDAENDARELALLQLQLQASRPPNPAVSLSSWSYLCSKSAASSTYPRRRRHQRSLMTLWHAEGLLDEVPTQQTRRLLQRIAEWDFNAFVFDRLTSGSNLATLCTHLLQENGLLRHYRLDPLVVRKFFYLAEQASILCILKLLKCQIEN